ncbi:ChaN family lipoprotein [Campylobacter coli]|uniref:Iron transporter n=1 Tax=Campylobacter coli TaxID=195 RepID=A0A689ZDJ3_CAMCO|nr:ChaN family lipoprotein [Campylobacter coli]EAH7176834.1 iron transporter [Campylobacter coli]EAH7505549.1 iron transporter [Campylobacter coli]EAH8899236.1 iron transporter [Campylobacter coli]EAI3228111.1 iron transporter [Campylobacter coli]EAI4264759.1 iron transporter [Campylobacter coli]
MKFHIVLSTLLISVMFNACAVLQKPSPLQENKDFYILDTHTQKKISFEDMILDLLKADVILLGEKHDEAKHKISQVMIFNALEGNLSSQNIGFDVALEMLASTEQNHLDKAFKNKKTIKTNELANALNWDKGWKWKDYDQFVNAVFYSRAKILGANLSRSEITSIYNGVQPLKGYVSTTNEVKKQIFDIISLSHKLNPQENKELLDKLVEIQQFKDRRMADVLVHHTNKVLLLAGSYHTSKKIGIPLHIQDFKSNKKIVVVNLNYGERDLKDSDYTFIYY